MDTCDVSDSNKYQQIFAGQKALLNAAKARQGQLPRDRKSSTELINAFMMVYNIGMMQQLTMKPDFQLLTSFLPPPYPPSTACLKELKQTYIKDLRLETHHRGNYLLVRPMTPPYRMTAIMAIVEDENGDAMRIQLYQQPDDSIRPSTSVIRENDVFLIKEPFFKIAVDGGYALRVDHVSDLVYIDASHNMMPTQWASGVLDIGKAAGDWKEEGNNAMKRKQYWEAVQSYTTALQLHPSVHEEKTIRLNRALAYLKEGSLDGALTDTQCLISTSNTPEKALYRAGKALYGLGRFSECHDILATLCKSYPNNADAVKELARVCGRLSEQQSGTYDFKFIYKEALETSPPQLDHATFIGPVMVKSSPGRGRGLFTTKAVKAGELLLCEKAFAHCYANTAEDNSKTNSKIGLLLNIHTNRITLGTQADLITTIVQKLWHNPSLLPTFTALHHGTYKPGNVFEVDGKPVIDTFLIERIISLNVFGCPITSYKSYFEDSENKLEHHSCGIWLMASMINHSCLKNVHRSFIGDLQFVRATCNIPADTELKFWYKIPTGEDNKMQKGLETWGFQCKCAICIDSKNTAKNLLQKRNDFLKDLEATLDASNIDTAKAERLLASIDKTYKQPPTTVPRLALHHPYLKLAAVYAKRKMAENNVSMALKALDCLGFVIKGAHLPALSGKCFEVEKWGLMMDGVTSAWIHLCNAYTAFAPHLVQQAASYAKLAYKICIGEDMTFEQSYGELAEYL